jgi:hypothetical protein
MTNAITNQLSRERQIAALEKDWASNPRWKGITRNYSAADVVRLRGSVNIEHTLAQRAKNPEYQYSVVAFTDGENTEGRNLERFKAAYAQLEYRITPQL